MTGAAWVWPFALLVLWAWSNRRWFAKLDRKQQDDIP